MYGFYYYLYTMKKYIPYAVIVVLVIIMLAFIPSRESNITKLYKDKANVIEMRLEQESIRNTAQANIDSYNEQIQVIDSKLFDAINGTTGFVQASQPQVVE